MIALQSREQILKHLKENKDYRLDDNASEEEEDLFWEVYDELYGDEEWDEDEDEDYEDDDDEY